jgi:membrane protease YdiL (CAAX protease family)
MFATNNLSLALLIPAVVLISWLIYHQGIGWLTSVTGQIRWRWLGWSAVVAVAFLLPFTVIEGFLTGWPELSQRPYSWFILGTILLSTPLQAAAEEYATRGLLSRAVTAIFPNLKVGLVLAWLVSSLVFVGLHSASDFWLNLYYFAIASLLWWITHRTGGLEAAIAIHAVNNLLSEAVMPWSDFSQMFDRTSGAASPWILLSIIWMTVMTVVVDRLARRRNLVRASAPLAQPPLQQRYQGQLHQVAAGTVAAYPETTFPPTTAAADLIQFNLMPASAGPAVGYPRTAGLFNQPVEVNPAGLLPVQAEALSRLPLVIGYPEAATRSAVRPSGSIQRPPDSNGWPPPRLSRRTASLS